MMTSHSEPLGTRLDMLIAEKGLTKAEFAEKINVKPQQISRWLKNTSFQWDQIKRFSAALEISEVEFLGLNQGESQ